MLRKIGVVLRSVLVAAMVLNLNLVVAAPASAIPGGLQWERPSAPGTLPLDVAVDEDGSYFVACPGTGSVEKFAADGTHLWSFNTLAEFGAYTSHLDLDGTGVYINIMDGLVAKLDKSTGAILWKASGLPDPGRPVDDVSVYDGIVYVTQPGLLDSWFMLDAATGAYISPVGYSTPNTEDAYYYVEVDSTGIYVWSNEQVLRRLDFERNVVWAVPLASGGGMVFDGAGYIYVPDNNTGVVNKISIADGSLVGTLYGQDGCAGVGYLNGVLYTTSVQNGVVRTYTEPWPDPTAPQDITKLTSPSHPDQDALYTNDSPGFTWGFSASKLYSWVIDQDPDGVPDLVADPVSPARKVPLGTPVTYPALYDPQSLAIGDFNEDGAMDFASGADDDSYGLTVHLNQGDGTFEEDEFALDATSYAADAYAEDLNVADLDGDEHLDIVFYDESSRAIGILWGLGDGTFGYELHPTLAGEYTLGVTVGNFDSQAGLDIAVNFNGLDHIEVWKSRAGDVRQFDRSAVAMPAGIVGRRAIGAADLNEDGYSEMIIGTGSGALLVAANDGAGMFTPESMTQAAVLANGGSAVMIRTLDVNADGDQDVVATNGDSLGVFLGDGAGALTESFDALSYLAENDTYVYPGAFALGDIDADGILDLCFGDEGAYEVVLMTGNGDGTFDHAGEVAINSMRGDGRGIGSADFNGDGRADVAIAGSAELHVLMGAEPTPYNVHSTALEDGTWYFHVREVNEKGGEWRGGTVATFKVSIAQTPVVSTQNIDNGILKLVVSPEGLPQAWVWGLKGAATEPGWVYQYYSEDSWGGVLWLGDDLAFTNGYARPSVAGGVFTPVSNQVEAIDGGKRLITVFDAGTTGVRVTQTFTLMDGDRFFTKTWRIQNTGDAEYTNLRFHYGGDTYFGGEDSASSYFDSAKSMVYVRNNEFMNWGIMGFYANPATPASRYFSGDYSEGDTYAERGMNLPNAADETFQDAGYYLQWNRAALTGGDQWDIAAYELWTPGGPLQMLAPGPQNVSAGSTVILPFTIQNLSEVPQAVTLDSTATSDWNAEIIGSTTPNLGAVAATTVYVKVTVPEGATGRSDIVVRATGPESDTEASTRLSVINLDVELAPGELDFEAAVGGKIVWKSIVFTNNSGASLTVGAPTASAPFTLGDASAAGFTLKNGESITLAVGLNPGTEENSFQGVLSLPVVSPELLTLTVPLTGTVHSSVTLHYAAAVHGSIEGSATQEVEWGSDGTTVTAVPHVGYVFDGWSDGVKTAARCDLDVSTDVSVTARFKLALGMPDGVTYGPTSNGDTLIRWNKALNARGYRVYVNGRLVATVSGSKTSYLFNGLVGPNTKVTIEAIGPGGVTSDDAAGMYKAVRAGLAGTLRFGGFTDRLTPKGKTELRRVAAMAQRQGFTRIEVAGHTSTRLFRGDAYHQQLSERRAKMAKAYLDSELKRRGVKATVVAKGYGRSRPIASNFTWWGRYLNRRVEVSMR